MKFIKRIILLLVVFGVIGLSSFVFFKFIDNKEYPPNSESNGFSKYPGVEIITETFDEKTYRGTVNYPEFKEHTLNTVINDYVSLTKENFHSELDSQNEHMSFQRPADFFLTFEIYPVVEHIYSIVFSEESYISGANGRQKKEIFLVDVEQKEFIHQAEIINDTRENRERIYQLLDSAFKQSERYKLNYFEDHLKEAMLNMDNQFPKLYLTEKSVVFKFDKYEVTAGAAGMPAISIPFEEFGDMFTKTWRLRLSLIDNPKDNQNITAPIPNETTDELHDKGDSDIEMPIKNKRVALTFDDGPHPQNTLALLELLEEYDAKATFFMLGSRVDFYPTIVRKVAEHGHEIGNHTWNHKDLTTLGSEEVEYEILKTNDIIMEVTGQAPSVFRPPYGAKNDVVSSTADTPIILWTIDTLDWKNRDPKAIFDAVTKDVEDGSIILMHDIHKTTVEAVESILIYLLEEGYEFVTVSEMTATKVSN